MIFMQLIRKLETCLVVYPAEKFKLNKLKFFRLHKLSENCSRPTSEIILHL